MDDDRSARQAGPGDDATRAGRLEDHLRDAGVLDEGDLAARSAGAPAADRFAEGRRVVARAWVDPGFRDRLLDDATRAVEELGMTVEAGHQPGLELRAVENTDRVHQLIVCTLCSCYPRALLGEPPAWYTSEAYRAQAVRDPRGLLEDFGVQLADDVDVRVCDSTAETRYLVVPQRPEGTDGWSEDALCALVTPEALIGTALVSAAVGARRPEGGRRP